MKKFFTIEVLILIIVILLNLITACNKEERSEESIENTTINEITTTSEITTASTTNNIIQTIESTELQTETEKTNCTTEEEKEKYTEYEEINNQNTTIYNEVETVEITIEYTTSNNNNNNVYTLANELYGLNEYDVTGCLKIISYEGYGIFGEWNLSYYCACATICCAIQGDVYRQFGRADTFYTVENFYNITIHDWAYNSFREALENLTYVYEINGIRSDYQNAIYDSWCNGYHFGVWQN